MKNRRLTALGILTSFLLALAVFTGGLATDAQARGGGRGGGFGGGPMAGGRGGHCISFDHCYNHCFAIGGISGDSYLPEACSRICFRRCNGLPEHAQGRF